MKKMKKIAFSCLFILTCMFGYSHSVFASDETVVATANCLNADKVVGSESIIFQNQSGTSAVPLTITLPNESAGFYVSAFVPASGISGFYLKNLKEYDSASPISSISNFDSSSSALYCFKQRTIGSKSWYNYLIDNGYDKTEVDKVLNDFFMLYPKGFGNHYDFTNSLLNVQLSNNYDLIGLYEYMKKLQVQGKKPWEDKKMLVRQSFI